MKKKFVWQSFKAPRIKVDKKGNVALTKREYRHQAYVEMMRLEEGMSATEITFSSGWGSHTVIVSPEELKALKKAVDWGLNHTEAPSGGD